MEQNSYNGFGGNPYYGQSAGAWQSPRPQKPAGSNRKFFIIIAILVVLLIIPICLVAFIPTGNRISDDDKKDPDSSGKDGPIKTEPPMSSEIDEDLYNYYLAQATSPDHPLSFGSKPTRYSEPPAGIPCDDLFEVPTMNTTMLNLYLQGGSVVIISGKGSGPFKESGSTILVYAGNLGEKEYYTIPFECPYSTTAKSTIYTNLDIFDNLAADEHYYAWTDLTGLVESE